MQRALDPQQIAMRTMFPQKKQAIVKPTGVLKITGKIDAAISTAKVSPGMM